MKTINRKYGSKIQSPGDKKKHISQCASFSVLLQLSSPKHYRYHPKIAQSEPANRFKQILETIVFNQHHNEKAHKYLFNVIAVVSNCRYGHSCSFIKRISEMVIS